MEKYWPERHAKILDVGAGTGLVGEKVSFAFAYYLPFGFPYYVSIQILQMFIYITIYISR